MPAVFVHGNPESSAIWDLLIPELDRDDVVTLSPPGFGAPCPEGWEGTRTDYAEWLIGELEGISEPIDLVGHDWGGGHVIAAVLERPDLIRSWAVDVAGLVHPDYVWHDMAQVWQTPEAGEEAVAEMLTRRTLEEKTAAFTEIGMTPEIAAKVAEAGNEEMARCILTLYRSAAQPAMAEYGADLSAAKENPGLVIVAEEDHYVGGEAMSRHSAERMGASVAVLSGVGHWWMIQDPKAGAEMLNNFWKTI